MTTNDELREFCETRMRVCPEEPKIILGAPVVLRLLDENAALRKRQEAAERKIAVARAFVDDGIPLSYEDTGTTCACCGADWDCTRQPPFDGANPDAPYIWIDTTEHLSDCTWVALVRALAALEEKT